MPQIRNWSLVSASQWYKVAHVLFEKYPYPVLFYSSTVNDEGMLKRIGSLNQNVILCAGMDVNN